MDSDNATANRMHIEGAQNAAPVVQEMVDELGETHAGADVGAVEDAVQEKWVDTFGEVAAPLDQDTAAEIAEHLSEGTEIKIVPPA
jgi:hypothetical protein